MDGKRKQYSDKFKAKVAIEAIKGDKTIAELSSMYRVHTSQIMKCSASNGIGVLDMV